MKILMVNKFLYPRGGSETYMFELARLLTEAGHQVEFFGMYDPRNTVPGDAGTHVANLEFQGGITADKLLYPFKILYSWEAKKKIAALMRAYRPDVVHINNFNFQLTPSILYPREMRGAAVIQTVHDAHMVCPAHRLFNNQTQRLCEECRGRKYLACAKNRCIDGSLAKSLLGTAEGALYKRLGAYETKVDCYIFPSQYLCDTVRALGVRLEDCRVLHNFTRASAPRPVEKKKRAVYFGGLTPWKGIPTLLEAVAALPDIPFVVAGSGPLEPRLKDYPNIEYVGFQQGDALFQLVAESYLSIFPSEWQENCSMTVIESLTLGTPVLGTALGGTAELIRPGEDGEFFQAGNAADLREKILWFFNNDGKTAAFSKQAARNAKRFDAGDYTKALLGIYQEQIKRKRAQNKTPA